jgi:deoxyribodipyrimidine photo-lyase
MTARNARPSDDTSACPATLVWLRRDLRLADSPALVRALDLALERGGRLLPLFVWQPEGGRRWAPGAAARWWLWRSLRSLGADLERRGSRLAVENGDPVTVVPKAAREAGADVVVWASGLDPDELADDERVAAALRAAAVEPLVVPQANLLFDPAARATREGRPYTVFTPYWRSCLAGPAPLEPLPAPGALPPAPEQPAGDALTALEREAERPWSAGFDEVWEPGEAGAHARLERFLAGAVAEYAADRDRPDLEASSRLSPHLRWGELTARQVWYAVAGVLAEAGLDLEAAVGPPGWDGEQAPGLRRSAGAFLRQLGWREFGHHLLRHFPETPERPLHERYAAFPWRDDPVGLEAWRGGGTGFPIVDAAMRELWTTGWMHNRARLLAGSFLVKDLLLPWQDGAAWFWDTLVDADLANNTLGWQWVSGCGADAAPYFRVFNPVTQGRRFDPDGAYVRRWAPELAGLPAQHLQAPWLAPAHDLATAGVRLGETYPEPIVDHGEARARALAAYEAVRSR